MLRQTIRPYTQSLNFNGTSDLATVPWTPSTTGFCFSCWLFPRKFATGTIQNIFDYAAGGPNGGFQFQYAASTRTASFNLYNGASSVVSISDNDPKLVGWRFYCITYIPNSTIVYVNAVSVATDTSCTMTDPAAQTPTLGRRSSSAVQFGNFSIAELCIQNTTTPWTQSQIQDLYFKSIYPSGSTFYSLNGGVLDQSGTNGLTLTGTSYASDSPTGARSIAGTRTGV